MKDYSEKLIDWTPLHILRMNSTREYVRKYDEKYGKLINICINNRLERDHQLVQHGYSEIEYCVTNDPLEVSKEFDWLTVVFLTIVVMIIGTVVGANVVEWIGAPQLKDHIVVTSFSIRRNWIRFTEVSKSEIYKDLGYIDGLRVCINIYVLTIHCMLTCILLPVRNPEFAEQLFESRMAKNLVSTVPISVQTFFVISGLLLMVNFLKDMERNPQFRYTYFFTKIANRWFRLLPVYYFFLLMTVVGHAIPGLKLGPLGYCTLIVERNMCRDRFWENLLFMNNLPFNKWRCFLQGWYLSADQQLFLTAMVVLALIWKYPKNTIHILTALLVMVNVLSVGITYKLGLEPVFPLRYSEIKFLFKDQAWFANVYLPSYTNANGFISGMIVGYLYHETKKGRLNINNSKPYIFLRRITTPMIAVGFLSSFAFYDYEFTRSSWTVLVHSFIYRNYGILAGCICFIYCFQTSEGTIRRVLASRVMNMLGKLSYSVYVLHVTLVRIMLNYIPALPEASILHVVLLLLALTVLSYAFGLAVYFFLEQPMSLLLKHCILERPSHEKKANKVD